MTLSSPEDGHPGSAAGSACPSLSVAVDAADWEPTEGRQSLRTAPAVQPSSVAHLPSDPEPLHPTGQAAQLQGGPVIATPVPSGLEGGLLSSV